MQEVVDSQDLLNTISKLEKLEEKNERTTLDFNKLKAEHYQLMSDN